MEYITQFLDTGQEQKAKEKNYRKTKQTNKYKRKKSNSQTLKPANTLTSLSFIKSAFPYAITL